MEAEVPSDKQPTLGWQEAISESQKTLHFAAEQEVLGTYRYKMQQRTGSPDIPATPIYPL